MNLIRLLVLVLMIALITACGGRETRPGPATGSGMDRVSPVRAAEINTRLGFGYMERGDTQLAMDKFRRAIDQDPEHVPAHMGLGMIYEGIGNERAALNHLRRAVRLAPEDGAAHNSYATLLCRTGQYALAEQHFRQAMEDPFYGTPEVALANAGACAKRAGDEESAEQYLRDALTIDANNEIALYHMADLSYQQGDAFRARAFIQRLEAVSDPEPGTLMLGYRIESALGSARDAERYAGLIQREFPNSTEAALLRQNDNDE